MNPWLQVSRRQEGVGEREGEDKVAALAVTAQSSSGPFTAASLHPEVPRLPFPSIDPVALMEEGLRVTARSQQQQVCSSGEPW